VIVNLSQGIVTNVLSGLDAALAGKSGNGSRSMGPVLLPEDPWPCYDFNIGLRRGRKRRESAVGRRNVAVRLTAVQVSMSTEIRRIIGG
jgi:hypothetical protein